MLLTPMVGAVFFFYLSVLLPIATIHHNGMTDEDTTSARWLAYFVCLQTLTFPLLIAPLLPFRYELMLGTSMFLAYDDARAARQLFRGVILPHLTRVQERMKRLVTHSSLPPESSSSSSSLDSPSST